MAQRIYFAVLEDRTSLVPHRRFFASIDSQDDYVELDRLPEKETIPLIWASLMWPQQVPPRLNPETKQVEYFNPPRYRLKYLELLGEVSRVVISRPMDIVQETYSSDELDWAGLAGWNGGSN